VTSEQQIQFSKMHQKEKKRKKKLLAQIETKMLCH
jgi:hypothetical protein